MKCNKCGNELNENDLFCGKCGNKIIQDVENEEVKLKKKRTLAIIMIVITIAFMISCICYIKNTENNIFDFTTGKSITDDSASVESSKIKDSIDINTTKNTDISNYNDYKTEKIEDVIITTDDVTRANTEKENKSIYESYLRMIKVYEEAANGNMSDYGEWIAEYALSDINNDGTKELIINYGTCAADYKYNFYSYKNGKTVDLGAINGGNLSLYEMNDGNYLKAVYSHGGAEIVSNISYENEKMTIKKISSKDNIQEEYKEGDTLVLFNNSSSVGELDKLK